LLYAKGLGVKQDYQKALYWWELAAKKGHPSAPIYVLKLKKKLHSKG
jgi:TPR repeat protein